MLTAKYISPPHAYNCGQEETRLVRVEGISADCKATITGPDEAHSVARQHWLVWRRRSMLCRRATALPSSEQICNEGWRCCMLCRRATALPSSERICNEGCGAVYQGRMRLVCHLVRRIAEVPSDATQRFTFSFAFDLSKFDDYLAATSALSH